MLRVPCTVKAVTLPRCCTSTCHFMPDLSGSVPFASHENEMWQLGGSCRVGKGAPRDSTATGGLPNWVSAAYTSPGKRGKERAAENPPSCPIGRSHRLENSSWKSVGFFLFVFWGGYVGVFHVKAHLEGTNASWVCKGWTLNLPPKALLQVPRLALTPPWTWRRAATPVWGVRWL